MSNIKEKFIGDYILLVDENDIDDISLYSQFTHPIEMGTNSEKHKTAFNDKEINDLLDFALAGNYDVVCLGYFCSYENKIDLIKYGIIGYGNGDIKNIHNKLIKKEIYDKIVFPCKRFSDENCYISCQILYYATKIGYYPQKLCNCNNEFEENILDRKGNYEHIIKFCKSKFGNDLNIFEPELGIRMSDIEIRLFEYLKKNFENNLSVFEPDPANKVINKMMELIELYYKTEDVKLKQEIIIEFIKNRPSTYFRDEEAASALANNWTGTLKKPQNLRFIENAIPIVSCVNENYAPYLSVFIQSIIDNSNPNRKYHFIIFERNFSTKTKFYFEDQVSEFSHIEIDFVDISSVFNEIPLAIHPDYRMSLDTYSRLFIPYWLDKYPKVICLDPDMIAKTDISELYDLNMENKCISATVVKDLSNRSEPIDFIHSTSGYLFIKNWFHAFQCGVLVFDILKFSEKNPYYDFLKFAIYFTNRYKKHTFDQCILNISIQNDYCVLPHEWNYTWAHRRNNKRYVPSGANTKIIHFAGDIKPWENNPEIENNPDTIAYREYAKKVKLYNERVNKKNNV